MSTQISYTPPSLQVIRDNVCYITPNKSEVQQGFHIISYMGEEEISRQLEDIQGNIVSDFTLTACPVIIQTKINNKQILVLRIKGTSILVYSVTNFAEDTVITNYYTITGDIYEGDINNLELVGDTLNYNAPVLLCVNGEDSITRTDVYDESANIVTTIWQTLTGAIVPEPTGKLTPGACELPLDTEVVKQIDNIIVNGKPSGKYISFYRVNVHDSKGNVIYSTQKLSDGTSYIPKGKISVEPIIPSVLGFLRRLTNNQSWETNGDIQSVSFTIERANKQNIIEIYSADSTNPVIIDRLNYDIKWSVDGSLDPNLQGLKIIAKNESRVLINWTEQPRIEEVTEYLNPSLSLDNLIDVPEEAFEDVEEKEKSNNKDKTKHDKN